MAAKEQLFKTIINWYKLRQFSNGVATKQSGHIYKVSDPPDWLVQCFINIGLENSACMSGIYLSSDIAFAKLNKHKKLGDVGSFVRLLEATLYSNDIEVRTAKHPRSLEVFIYNETRLWLIAYKLTSISEIVVSSAYRVDERRLEQARQRNLLHGIVLNLVSVGGRP